MKRVAAFVLLAGAWPIGVATAADPPVRQAHYLPTSPLVPAPGAEKGEVVQASGIGRFAKSSPGSGSACAPAATPAPACGTAGCPAGGSPRGGCVERVKAWLCFRPTTGDALPKLRPAPYYPPVVGTFACSSAAGYGCATGNGCGPAGNGCAAGDQAGNGNGNGNGNGTKGGKDGCAAGAGGLRGLLAGHGRKATVCVPPGDDAFPGLYFARPENPTIARRVAVSAVPISEIPPTAVQPPAMVVPPPASPPPQPGPAGYLARPTVPPTGTGSVAPAGGTSAARPAAVPLNPVYAATPSPNPLTRPLTRP